MANSVSVEVNSSGQPEHGLAALVIPTRTLDQHNKIEAFPCGSDRNFLEGRARRLAADPSQVETDSFSSSELAFLLPAVVSRCLGSVLDPEEARQEAWLVLLSMRPLARVGDDQDDLQAWVVVIIRNHLADLKRRARRRVSKSLSAEEADVLVGREEDPAAVYERSRVQALVRSVLEEARGRLSETSHRILMLRGIEGRSYEEIAEAVGMTVIQVRDRHRRAISCVRDLFLLRFRADPTGFSTANPQAHPPELNLEEVES